MGWKCQIHCGILSTGVGSIHHQIVQLLMTLLSTFTPRGWFQWGRSRQGILWASGFFYEHWNPRMKSILLWRLYVLKLQLCIYNIMTEIHSMPLLLQRSAGPTFSSSFLFYYDIFNLLASDTVQSDSATSSPHQRHVFPIYSAHDMSWSRHCHVIVL